MCALSSKGHTTNTAKCQCKFCVALIYVNNALDIKSLLFLSNIAKICLKTKVLDWYFHFVSQNQDFGCYFHIVRKVIKTGFEEMICHVTVYPHSPSVNLVYVWHKLHLFITLVWACLEFVFRNSCCVITNTLQISISLTQVVSYIIKNRISMW